MKKLIIALFLFAFTALFSCGDDSSNNSPEPVDFFNLEVDGEFWVFGEVQTAGYSYNELSTHLIFIKGNARSGAEYVSILVETSELQPIYTHDGGPYNTSGSGLQPLFSIRGVDGDFDPIYATTYCASPVYRIEITELDEENQTIRGRFSGKVCLEDLSDSVMVSNGEFYVEYPQ